MGTETPDMAEAEGEWRPCEHPGDDCEYDYCECQCDDCYCEEDRDIEDMESALRDLGIGPTAAEEYAAQLCQCRHTLDTLQDISKEEMQKLDFKNRHIREIIKAQGASFFRPPCPEIEEMTSTLLTFGIERTAAAEYAAQLVEKEGYDTPESLHVISEKEMQKLDFTQKHIKLVLLGVMEEQLEQDTLDADLWFKAAAFIKVKINCEEYTRRQCYEKCRTLDRDSNKARYWHCLGYAGGGTVDGKSYSQKECFQEALNIHPQYTEAWNLLGIVGGFTQAGKSYSKKECYQEALNIDPQYSTAWCNLGAAGGGKVAAQSYSPRRCYIEALKIDPQYTKAWCNLGVKTGVNPVLSTLAGKSYSKKECFQEALKIDPQHKVAWLSLGNAGGGTLAGKSYSNKECYLEALKIDPRYSMAWNNLGNAGYEEGFTYEVEFTVDGKSYSKKECYQEALKIDPKNDLPRKSLVELNDLEEKMRRDIGQYTLEEYVLAKREAHSRIGINGS